MNKEITLKEAEKIVDDMYQKRWIECGVENGNTIHMGNLDKLQYSELEKASILLLRTEIRLQSQLKKQKEVIDKAIKCIDYNTKYRNGADIYQFVDIESEILEPLKFILELDEENGNAYLKEFNDWLKEVS